MKTRLPFVSLATAVTLAFPSLAAPALTLSDDSGDTLSLSFDPEAGTTLEELIQLAHEFTDYQISYFPGEVRDVRFHFVGTKALPREKFWSYFHSILRGNGFALVPYGEQQPDRSSAGYYGICRVSSSGRNGVPPLRSLALYVDCEHLKEVKEQSALLITTSISLQWANSQEVTNVISGYCSDPNTDGVRSTNSTNTITISGFADSVTKLVEIARSLDAPMATVKQESVRIPLHHAIANEVRDIVTNLLRRGAVLVPSATPIPIADAVVQADPRSNALIVFGTVDQLAQIQKHVAAIDVPFAATPMTHVFKLQHTAANDMASILNAWNREPTFRFVADPRTNSVIATGPINIVDQASAVVMALDIPVTSATTDRPSKDGP